MDSPLMLFSFRYSAGNAALNSGDNNGAVTAYKDAVAVWEKSDKRIHSRANDSYVSD